jgi:hypothetical protein
VILVAASAGATPNMANASAAITPRMKCIAFLLCRFH